MSRDTQATASDNLTSALRLLARNGERALDT